VQVILGDDGKVYDAGEYARYVGAVGMLLTGAISRSGDTVLEED
jgi:hypothetical protein